LIATASIKGKEKTLFPHGSSVTGETPGANAELHPGKDAGGTEINPSPFKIAVCAVDITFFMLN